MQEKPVYWTALKIVIMKHNFHYFNGCCPNTQWNPEKDMCEDCPSGYYWIYCSKPCQYPYYGSKCGHICSCEENNCDHMSGCKSGKRDDDAHEFPLLKTSVEVIEV
uniref:Uncharacterized protein n=1 Tax=Magallana gigas TaxID=29159 RepID=K1Q8B4_MAGGI